MSLFFLKYNQIAKRNKNNVATKQMEAIIENLPTTHPRGSEGFSR